jgi:hypothetical protein
VEVPWRLVSNGTMSLSERVQALLACDDITVPRWHKKGSRRVNIRPGIVSLEAIPPVGATITVSMLLHEEAEVKAKPPEVLQALFGLDENQLRSLRVYKHEAFVHDQSRLVPLMRYRPRLTQDREVCV